MKNSDVAREVLRRISAGHISAISDLLLPEATMELPFAPAGVPQFTQGADNIVLALNYVSENFSLFDFKVQETYATKDEETVVLEATSLGTVNASCVYQNRYVFVFTFVNGKISRWKEFFNPDRI